MQETIIHKPEGGGMQVPGYRVLRPLGAGGMASVYLAVQESLDREVALKVMSPQLAADREFTERFLKEGRITARLSHPNLVTVFDIGSHQGVYYLAAEYIDGGTLRDRMQQGMTVPEVLDVVADVARALHYAHDKGVVHRDVKPSNILYKANGTVVLADFGIAKAMDTSSTATLAGASIGTPDYMSPEQARGEPVDGRSDLYALGVMLFELLIGKPPYDGSDPFAVALAHITQPVPVLPSEFAWLQPILDGLMAKRAQDRFANGEVFLQELARIRTRMPKPQGTQLLRHDTAKRLAIESAPTVAVGAPTRSTALRSGRRTPLLLVAGLLGVSLVGGLLWLGLRAPVSAPAATGVDGPTAPAGVSPPVVALPGDLSDVELQLAKANSYLETGTQPNNGGRRLVFPEGDSALDLFRKVLEQQPQNAQAQAGIARIARFYEENAGKFCERSLWHACATAAREGLRVDPNGETLQALLVRAERGSIGD